MSLLNRSKLEAAVQRLLYPIIKLLIDFGVTEQHFSSISREVFIKAAADKIAAEDSAPKPTATRVSMMTGIRRQLVKPILDGGSLPEPNDKWYRGRCAKVLADWHGLSEYLTDKGGPKALPLSGKDIPSIESLVQLSGRDLSHHSIAEELLSVGAVHKRKKDDLYVAKRKTFQRRGVDIQSLESFADEIFDLAATKAVLLRASEEDHTKVMADTYVSVNVNPESLHVLLRQLREAGASIISRSQQAIERHSLGEEKAKDGLEGERVGVGIYIYVGDEMAESQYVSSELSSKKKIANQD